jgi:hypothetical protein
MPGSSRLPRVPFLGIGALFLFVLGGDGIGGGGWRHAALASAQEPTALRGITAAHNAARAEAASEAGKSIPPLAWSPPLAEAAQAWAHQCRFQHSKKGYGENLFASSGQAPPEEAVRSWVSEKKFYDEARNRCRGGECRHYTQVMWAHTMRVGCAVARCSGHSPFGRGAWQFLVCEYDPPGNYIGERPY